MRPLGAAAAFLLATPVLAQTPDLPARGSSTAAFVPAGYQVLREATGHLNGDEYRDVVLILADAREAPDSAPPRPLPRLLLVLAGEASGYRLEAVTDKGVLGRAEGAGFGDPLEGIAIDRNVIVVSHQGGSTRRWRFVHRFRFQAGAYQLIGRTTTTYSTGAFCRQLDEYRPTTRVDDDLLTGQRKRYDIPEHRCVRRERRSRIVPTRTTLAGFDLRKDVADR